MWINCIRRDTVLHTHMQTGILHFVCSWGDHCWLQQVQHPPWGHARPCICLPHATLSPLREWEGDSCAQKGGAFCASPWTVSPFMHIHVYLHACSIREGSHLLCTCMYRWRYVVVCMLPAGLKLECMESPVKTRRWQLLGRVLCACQNLCIA